MYTRIKSSFLFFIFTLCLCLSSFFLTHTDAQDSTASASDTYTFETIDVPGVDFLAVTASSDFEDYAGYTKSADGEKEVAFTLIDGVFTTYDFPGSKNTYFYALGNNGDAAGHYEDSDGLFHGVALKGGELERYDFPGAIETELWGISDATGALTGNFIDASGVRRGFSGDEIIEFPGASATYADFVNASGGMVGSYVDADGTYHAYVREPDGMLRSFDFPGGTRMEYYFVHGINDVGTYVARFKMVDEVPGTYIGTAAGRYELRFPDSVSTQGYNINQDGSVVGHYDTPDGHRHGFIARPPEERAAASNVTPTDFHYTFESIDVPGVTFLALTASSDFQGYAGNTRSPDGEKMVGFTLVDGVFTTYDFPGSKNTFFYAFGNDGRAAGHYEDSNGRYHGVILENGELRQYDFPGAAETFIYGISDATGDLTGNIIDASGVRRGFSGERIFEFPGATATYADFVSAGRLVGSYIDADGLYHAYIGTPDGALRSFDFPEASQLEYSFVHGINDAGTYVVRAKAMEDVPRTYVGTFRGRQEVQFPGSVSTEGWNINQDGSIVGHYESADGRTHGFIARPTADTAEPGDDQPVIAPTDLNYTFETIDVPGVDFLAVAASSDYEDYAGYTRRATDEKIVAFTLLNNGVFTTYDFPGAQETRFYALGNNGNAAGYYVDSEGLHRGIVLENGELRQYDFPGSVQTEIYGISDSTGKLTGNFIDDSGVRRGFTGDEIVTFPGALETYADFINSLGGMVGSYVDANGVYHPYVRTPTGRFLSLGLPLIANLEYFFVHGINDEGAVVARTKAVDGVPLTYAGSFQDGLKPFKLPGSVSTEGYNINQDGSIVGHYDSADGRRHGFIARPVTDTDEPGEEQSVITAADLNYTFETIDVPGVDFLAVAASSDYEDYAGYTRRATDEKIVAFTLLNNGAFTTYDFPGAQETRFYALGNNGNAAGYYVDSEGLHRGIVLENGELRQYDFPGSIQTEIYGISDSTGKLTGNFIDDSGVRRGFTGDEIITFPEALETFADFVNSLGGMVGSYVDADGLYYPYVRTPTGRFVSLDLPRTASLEYFFVHGINDAETVVCRTKAVDSVPLTYVGTFQGGLKPFKLPGSVSTEGYNINQDGSIVGHYESADGRTHGFIARPTADTAEPGDDQPVIAPTDLNYTFETIDVPGAETLVLTASSDFEDYAGNTQSADGEKQVAFTLIDGVFTTYDFPGAKNTYFYALGNNGNAAGHYEDSEGLHHGIVLENGELRQYDFPGSVETEIYGISDATGKLTGNFTDASGVRRGFTGEIIVEVPEATATYADFINAGGTMVGSYVDANGIYRPYYRRPDGRFITIDSQRAVNREYLFVHGINDLGVSVVRLKLRGDIPRTYVGRFREGLIEVRFPGSVSTEGYNINQDGSIVGNYKSADGRTHGFIARPVTKAVSDQFSNAYTVTLSKGLNMLSVPLAQPTPMNARSLAGIAGATTIITLDTATQQFVAWTPSAPDDGFLIEGGKGYIVNVPQPRNFAFVGAQWTNPAEATAAPAITPLIRGDRGVTQDAWAFVVSGHLVGKPAYDDYKVSTRNLRTHKTITASAQDDYFAAATVDLTRQSVVQVGDVIEVRVLGPDGNVESQTHSFKVTPEHLANAVLTVRLDGIGQPNQNLLLQNYPNPFNPETWIPYQLSEDAPVSVSIYDTTGQLIRTLSLGFQAAGFYNSRERAAYWDGRNALGERVASGIYFYQLTTPSFQQTRRLVIVK